MNFKGIITAAMPVASGTSKSGKEWRRASYILQYDNSNEQYPKSVLFDVMGDKIEQLNIQQGVEYEVEIDFTCREYNGRTYMSASAWKATPLQQPSHAPANDPYAAMGVPQREAQAPKDDIGDPLPF